MSYYRVTGTGAQASGPIEKVFATAQEAAAHSSALRRLCGKLGRVEVAGKDGRVIGPDRLDRLVQAERVAAAAKVEAAGA